MKYVAHSVQLVVVDIISSSSLSKEVIDRCWKVCKTLMVQNIRNLVTRLKLKSHPRFPNTMELRL